MRGYFDGVFSCLRASRCKRSVCDGECGRRFAGGRGPGFGGGNGGGIERADRESLDAGDFENAYRAAYRITELEPDDAAAYLAAAGALLAQNEQNEQEMKRLLAQILTNSPDSAQLVGDWLSENGMEGAVELPFMHDYADESEINSVGNTTGNLTNALLDGVWRGGFVTTQAGWVYFSRFTDDGNAIYKMRSDGSALQRLGDAHGYSLNVVGDWLYFADPYDDCKPYRMRTDGSELEKLADFACSFLTVSGDWVYSDGFGEESTLCRFRTDGTDQTALTDFMVISCCVYGDWVYFCQKQEGGLMRIRTDGSQMQPVITDIPLCYAISDDAIYYVNTNDRFCVMQCDLDVVDPKEIFRGRRRHYRDERQRGYAGSSPMAFRSIRTGLYSVTRS